MQYFMYCMFFLCRTHGDLVSGLYHQILLSLQKVLSDPVRPLCSHYGAVVGLHALGWKVCSLPPPVYMYLCISYNQVKVKDAQRNNLCPQAN